METHIRKNMIKYIKDNITEVSDTDITSIYGIIINEMKTDTTENINRFNKIVFIEKNLQYMEILQLKDIEKIIIKSLTYEESQEEKMQKIVLEIVNKILIEMGKKEINNLCDFVDVRRDIMMDTKYKNIFESNSDYIFKNGFSKMECGVYQKIIKNPQISILKGMLKKIGYELCSKHRSSKTNNERETYTVYHIQKIDSI